MAPPFVCEGCGHRVDDPYKRFEERTEYRDVRHHGRYAVILRRHLCKSCVDEAIAEVRPQSDQGALL